MNLECYMQLEEQFQSQEILLLVCVPDVRVILWLTCDQFLRCIYGSCF